MNKRFIVRALVKKAMKNPLQIPATPIIVFEIGPHSMAFRSYFPEGEEHRFSPPNTERRAPLGSECRDRLRKHHKEIEKRLTDYVSSWFE